MASVKCIPVCLLMVLLFACDTQEEPVREQLWYSQPAENWFEALPLGNGRLGAMVYGTVKEERLQLNEESLWAGCPENPYPALSIRLATFYVATPAVSIKSGLAGADYDYTQMSPH